MTTTGALGKCPLDSQAVVDAETTPTAVFDGTTIFQMVDQVNCIMRLTRPGSNLTLNKDSYTATVNTAACAPSEAASTGSSGGGIGSVAGTQSASAGQTVKLETLAVNATRPTAENPNQPFAVQMVMSFTPPTPKSQCPQSGCAVLEPLLLWCVYMQAG